MSQGQGNKGGNNGNNNGGKNPAHEIEREKTKDFRKPVLKRDNKTCYYCGGLGLTVDHRLPIDLGGLSNMENLVCCCDICNNEKGNMTESDYRTYCVKRETDLDLQNHRKKLERKLYYVDCSKCNKKTVYSQLKLDGCQSCRDKKNNKKGH